jgi:hypothetical protein
MWVVDVWGSSACMPCGSIWQLCRTVQECLDGHGWGAGVQGAPPLAEASTRCTVKGAVQHHSHCYQGVSGSLKEVTTQVLNSIRQVEVLNKCLIVGFEGVGIVRCCCEFLSAC